MPGPFRERQRRLSPVRYALFSLIGLAPFSSLLSPNPGPAVASLVRPPAAVRAAASHRQAHKAGVAASSRHSPAQTTHVVSYDRYSMMLDGRRVLLFGGEYQFWRTPAPDQWPHVLALMRAAGLNTVTVGVSWQYHSPAPGVYDFSGIRDLGRFLDDAAAAGLYVIARPGPAYNSESNASNLPGWLLSRAGNLRANSGHAYCGAGGPSSAYAAAYTEWFRHVLPIIAARQYSHGTGTVVALQIENEYSPLCGTPTYMRELHDLTRELGIDVPLIANNNICCTKAGSWYVTGDDGEPIVDIPAEDDYPCPKGCSPTWDATTLRPIDSLEVRMRAAGVSHAPIAVAELQGGYFNGWGGESYQQIAQSLTPGFREVVDGSVLGQGATLVSIYMIAGGTSWGYLAGPNTATSYDYGAPIHEWGVPGPGYAALKRTGMFVQAFEDALVATEPDGAALTATNRNLLYAVRRSVSRSQKNALFIVLRNADPHRTMSTQLQLPVGRTPVRTGTITLGPHSLQLLLANFHITPTTLLWYSTSRPLTQASIDGGRALVFYGEPGTMGETSLAFAHRPSLLRVDRGIAASYDSHAHRLLLRYRHGETPRYVVLATDRGRLVLVFTGPDTAARTWRLDSEAGQLLLIGPQTAYLAGSGGGTQLQIESRDTTPLIVWAPRRLALVPPVAQAARIQPRAGVAGSRSAAKARFVAARRDATLRAVIGVVTPGDHALVLPQLTTWRFQREGFEASPSFDDRTWRPVTERQTSNPNVPSSDVALADDYGFHYGFVWYRGRFTGTGQERALRLYARNSYSVWLNGRYLGSSTVHNDLKNIDDQLALDGATPDNGTYADGLFFGIPRHLVRRNATNVIAILVESLGHNAGFANGERARSPFGLLDALLIGPARPIPIRWKIQGALGGEQSYALSHDGVNTPLNASGLYGERHGWYRVNFDDRSWQLVTLPHVWSKSTAADAGIGWYRTSFNLDIPQGMQAPLGLYIPRAQDKVAIWLNGLLIGRYWDGVGPQHTFYLPAGLLNEHGRNTLALAVWDRGHQGGLTGGVSLRPYDVHTLLSFGLVQH